MQTATRGAQPRMVALLRESKGWTQAQLADAVGISQGHLSKIETGLVDADSAMSARVAEVLDCPPALLASSAPLRGVEVSCLHHRRRRSRMTVAEVKQVEGLVHLSRLTTHNLHRAAGVDPEVRVERRDIDVFGPPDRIAADMRAAWRVPSGPISSVMGLLDSIGVVVLERKLPTAHQDAVSVWGPEEPPVMVLRGGLTLHRQRFTLAHELGHLVMHEMPTEDQEREANAFAAALLAPPEEIVPELADLTTRDTRRLTDLKVRWGLSIGALIEHAYRLNCISDRQHREFRVKLNRLGWTLTEPGDRPGEPAPRVHELVEALRREGRSLEEIAAAALMTPSAFTRHYLGEAPALETTEGL